MAKTMPRVHSAPNHSLASLVIDPDDYIYFRQMKSILDSFPNTGPPQLMTQLSNNLFIGSLKNADDINSVKANGITHVLNCAGTRNLDLTRSHYKKRSGISDYLLIPAEDHGEYNIMSHFVDAIAFLDKCNQNGGKALVHCNLGINRSGAICAAYLMVSQQMPLLEVVTILKEARGLVLCNKGFRRQLIRFARLRGYLDVPKYLPQFESIKFGNDRTNTISISNCHPYNDVRKAVSTDALNMYSVNGTYNNPAHFNEPKMLNGYSSLDRNDGNLDQLGYSSGHNSPFDSPRFTRGSSNYSSSRSVGDNNDYAIKSNKRPTAASHYEKAYFMDTIPEDGKHKTHAVVRESSAPPADRYAINNTKSLSSFGAKAKAEFKKSKSTRSISCDSYSKSLKSDNTSSTSSSSTTRPLRVYRRSVTDTEIYQKPSSAHTYKRADTVATSDIASGLERLNISDKASSMPSGLSQRPRLSSARISLSSSIFSRFKSEWRKS